MGKLNELNAEAKKLGYKYYWNGADINPRVSFRSPDNSFEGIFDKDGYRLNYTSNQRSAGPSKESVDLAEKFYKAYSELQRKIEPGRNDWKQAAALLEELKEADDGKRPSSSIWGRPDHCKKLAPGVYTVDTPSHGGIMVSASVASKVLSSETLAHCSGLLENGYYQFEEDCDVAIPLAEMYRKGVCEGLPWNAGRQGKFYELCQREVLRSNPLLFEKWSEVRGRISRSEKEPEISGTFASTSAANPTLTEEEASLLKNFMPELQLRAFNELSRRPEIAAEFKAAAAAAMAAPKVGAETGESPSPIILHYIHPSGTECFVTEIGNDGEAWGFQCVNGDWQMAEWGPLDLNEIKRVPGMVLDFHVPEGMTVERWLGENHAAFFPQFKENTVESEKDFEELLYKFGVSGEKALEGLLEGQKDAFRLAWAKMDGEDLSWGAQEEIAKEGFARFKEASKAKSLKTIHYSDNVYEPKPVALEDIVGQMDFRLEVTESGKLKLWDLQKNEYLGKNAGFDNSEDEDYEYSDASDVLERLDVYIDDYFIKDMSEQLSEAGVDPSRIFDKHSFPKPLYELCEVWKSELEKGSETLSKGELNLALGIVNPDTVIMPEKYVSAKKDYEKKLKDFNELVYEYGASGTKALEGFSEEQRLVVRLAWKEFNEEDSLEETDEKINSHFEEFMEASKPAAEQTASEEKVTCENFQKKLAERAERDAIKTAQALLSEMDAAEREKFNGIVRSQGLKKPEDVDAFFAALAKGTAAFEPKERKRTPPEPGLGM